MRVRHAMRILCSIFCRIRIRSITGATSRGKRSSFARGICAGILCGKGQYILRETRCDLLCPAYFVELGQEVQSLPAVCLVVRRVLGHYRTPTHKRAKSVQRAHTADAIR
jgi:hypothetical protein